MNDPGLGEPIEETSDTIDRQDRAGKDVEKETWQAYMKPSRWWFASTAFPLIAATLGPMASAFNICALAVHWRVEIPPGGNEGQGIDVRDPKWLLAINGLSLGLALIANIALLLNMTRRVSFSVAQPILIVGWYISSFLLVGDICGIIHMVKKSTLNRALTQAYYYAIFAAALYFFIATLMLFTVYGAWRKHFQREFQLSKSQRTLMLQTIAFMIYMVGGAGVYAKIEGFMFLDALFFTNYTLLTVGIGNIAPKTHLGRGLLFPYAVGGIVTVGLVIGSIRSLMLERGKDKLAMRMTEKKRRALVQKLNEGRSHKIRSMDGSDEKARREEEFNLMRRVQQTTETRQKWIGLLVSGSAWFFLWLVGALVFYLAEDKQGWTYFQSLYFAYTSLLTIGYGDFVPISNAGKSFFVIWSLLAVPSLTIVIGSMGDTVIKGIKDATNLIGELTLLPGEATMKERFQSVSTLVRRERSDEKETKSQHSERSHERTSERDSHDESKTTSHQHILILVQEIRTVLKHMSSSPGRKYEYDEWVWYLKLLGEDERSKETHRSPSSKLEHNEKGHENLQQAGGGPQEKKTWSWLGERSPLMGGTPEVEWVLERLIDRMEMELREIHMPDAQTIVK